MRMRARSRGEHGAAAVETAICLCFVVLPLTFAIIGYAFMLSFRQSLSQAATEGARAAAVQPSFVAECMSTNTASVPSSACQTKAASATVKSREAEARLAVANALQGLVGTHTCGDGQLTCSITFGTCAGSTARCATIAVSYPYRANPLIPAVPLLGFVYPTTLSYQAVAELS